VYAGDDADGDVTARTAKHGHGHEHEAVTELRASLHEALHRPQKGSGRPVVGPGPEGAQEKDPWGPPVPRKLPVAAGGGGGDSVGGDVERRATHDATAVEEGLAAAAR